MISASSIRDANGVEPIHGEKALQVCSELQSRRSDRVNVSSTGWLVMKPR
jgi:hypothetical protein